MPGSRTDTCITTQRCWIPAFAGKTVTKGYGYYCMLRYLFTGLLVAFLIGSAVAEPLQTDLPAGSVPVEPEQKKSSPVPAILTIGAAAGAGVGAFFLIRRARRERRQADSVIALVEKAWQRSAKQYAAEHYREAVQELQGISANWYQYEQYSARYRKNRKVHSDSIQRVIASCDFLEGMIPVVSSLARYAERLPTDEFALSKMSRREVQTAKDYLQTSMDSLLNAYPNHRSGLRYSMRHIDKRLRSLDSLIQVSYDDRKADFTFKNRFYYNRAVDKGDTASLRQFVDDCDYFQVDREWCQRARLAMEGREGADAEQPVAALPPGKKMSTADSIEAAFTYAMQSKRIEVLEDYVRKYSSRRYRSRSRRRLVRIEEVKAALRQLRSEVETELAFNRAYPRFGNGDFKNIALTVKGVSGATEQLLHLAWDSLETEVSKLPSIRFPASLTIDYTSQPPMILLDAVVSSRHDIEKSLVNSRPAFRIISLIPAMELLHRFKLLSLQMIGNSGGDHAANSVTDFLQKKVQTAIYGLRLHAAGDKGTILFYAREPEPNGGALRFYDFYDLTIRDSAKRFSIYPGSLPNIIPSLSSDSLEHKMTAEFFGE